MKYFKDGEYTPLTKYNSVSYKSLYLTQKSTNKGLLIALSLVTAFGFCLSVGMSLRYKSEMNRLQRQATIGLEQADQWSQYAQMLEAKLLTPESQDPQFIIERVFGKDAGLFKKIASCESSLNPNAKNKTSSARGLLQIMSSVHKIDQKWLKNPMINALVAKQLFDEQGTTPWNASKHCWSK